MNPAQENKITETDLLVIGGGINGVGIARDAAGRGLRVLLCEKDDLAQHTSSASTKLIHGGLRYLEQYDFKLVRHALLEREVLLHSAPHIIHPLNFILPYQPDLRPRWMIRFGLFLYDHLGGRKRLSASKSVDLRTHPAGKALKQDFTTGFEYSDCWVQDARLVVLTAMDAEARGASILVHSECTVLDRFDDYWMATLRDNNSGQITQVKAKSVINAAGPWVEAVLNLGGNLASQSGIRFVKGSHLVVPKLFDHPHPYIFQNGDGRIIFAIPFERDFTLLGTTDVEVTEIPEKAVITKQESTYICEAVSEYFKKQVNSDDAVWSYSGVRPLYDNAASNAANVTRDYHLDLNVEGAPIISVYGGKITTHRRLAEEVMALLSDVRQVPGQAWTAGSQLPGGDIPDEDMNQFISNCQERYPWLGHEQLEDYVFRYGSRITVLLEGCGSIEDLGLCMSQGVYEREVTYLMKHEYAYCAEDVLWRRTKQGLYASEEETQLIDSWMDGQNKILTSSMGVSEASRTGCF